MIEPSQMRALFVTNGAHVADRPGGVQACSKEYLALLKAAGFSVQLLTVDVDRRLTTRIRRRLRGSPYVGSISVADIDRILMSASEADFIFLNQVSLAGALTNHPRTETLLRRVTLLSHGAEVTDLLHQARAPRSVGNFLNWRPSLRTVKNVLEDEILSRRGISTAICLTPFDADFERWLGVKYVTWFPRVITPDALQWSPVPGRFGFLGTLDHVPNLDGLLSLLQTEIWKDACDLSIRVVGGPSEIGRKLASSYARVEYLGQLDDQALRDEAGSWTAFLNPIFCQARGCSTKLATALGWEIPVITTNVGKRGYADNNNRILALDDPVSFVRAMLMFKDHGQCDVARQAQQEAVGEMYTIAQNAIGARKFLIESQKHTLA